MNVILCIYSNRKNPIKTLQYSINSQIAINKTKIKLDLPFLETPIPFGTNTSIQNTELPTLKNYWQLSTSFTGDIRLANVYVWGALK